MKNLLNITALLSASILLAGSMTGDQTEMSYTQADRNTISIKDQDTTINKRKTPKNNRKRDMGDSMNMRPDRRTDTTDIQHIPNDTLPHHAPKHSM